MAGPVRVVIVDDEEDLRAVLRLNLGRDRRFDIVGEASDGADAVEVCRALTPDAVILDLRMPRADGLTVLPEISRSAKTVVLFTAFAEMVDVSQAEDLGAAAVWDKGAPLGWVADRLVELVEP